MTGQDNILLGVNSGSSMTSGDNNTFIAHCNANTDGYDNTFVGYQSGKTNVSGGRNTSLGKDTLKTMNGADNTAIGSNVHMH